MPVSGIFFNGGAASAQNMANYLNTATGGKGVVQEPTHQNDFVGKWIGGNAVTGGLPDIGGVASHGSYTGYEPLENTSIGGVDISDLVNRAWGQGNHSTPMGIPATNAVSR